MMKTPCLNTRNHEKRKVKGKSLPSDVLECCCGVP